VLAGACGQPTGFVQAPILHTDDDGIPDAEDECPSDAETRNGYEDDDGCPDEIRDDHSMMSVRGRFPAIHFPKNGHTLDANDIEVLDYIARALQKYPDVNVEISGHTDNQGSQESNQAISLRRAEVVRDYLVEQGIEPERLTVVSRGATEPSRSNDDRRVEFEVLYPNR
jgi:outer membrane protein OmpA-like peptidoglycan-associated protein